MMTMACVEVPKASLQPQAGVSESPLATRMGHSCSVSAGSTAAVTGHPGLRVGGVFSAHGTFKESGLGAGGSQCSWDVLTTAVVLPVPVGSLHQFTRIRIREHLSSSYPLCSPLVAAGRWSELKKTGNFYVRWIFITLYGFYICVCVCVCELYVCAFLHACVHALRDQSLVLSVFLSHSALRYC